MKASMFWVKTVLVVSLTSSPIFGNHVFAQFDSLAISKAKWKKQKIASGVKLKTFHFGGSLFSSNQNVSILEVKQGRGNIFDLGFHPKELKGTSEFATEASAIAALNGTFFNRKAGGSWDFIKHKGKVINENTDMLKGSGRIYHQRAALVFTNGWVNIAEWDGTDQWERNLQAESVLVTGPLLLINSKPHLLDSIDFNISRHPRSFLATGSRKRIYLITVDGRNDNSQGLSLFEAQRLLSWMGMKDGINLDGGGSTTLWTKFSGIVNYPTDNKRWDHKGERDVANAVLILKK